MTTSPASSAEELTARVRANLASLTARIERARTAAQPVRVVAVTKTFAADAVAAAHAAGLDHVGENYVTELVAKRPVGPPSLCWHFLGAVQTNKARALSEAADVISSISRVREVAALARHERRPQLDVEVNFTGREDRGGCRPTEALALCEEVRRAGFALRGLMTVAPPDPAAARRAFAALAGLADAAGVTELSMGMSDDLEWAVAAGSTEVRVGRALFGPRPAPDHEG